MLTRRLFCEKLLRNVRQVCSRRYSTQEMAKTDSTGSGVLPPAEPKAKTRRPFAKDLFLGLFNTDILAYPEFGTMARYTAFVNWLKPVEDFISTVEQSPNEWTREKVLQELTELGVFRASINEEYTGYGFSQSEQARLVETVSALPWVGAYLVKNNILPVYLISKYGTEEQKYKYLPKIANGTVNPTICITEFGNGTNVYNMKCSAVAHIVDAMLLSGVKHFVPNGAESNLFIVFAKRVESNDISEKHGKLTAFLVEKGSKGIKCGKSEDMIGQNTFPLSTVTFDKVLLPDENMMGQPGSGADMLKELLPPGTQRMAPYSIALLKKFLNLLIKHVLHNKHFDHNMHEVNIVKYTIAEISGTLYSMESTLYLTTGMEDQLNDQDVEAEKAITETYCARECLKSMYKGLQLLSTYGILERLPYAQLYNSALYLPMVESNSMEAGNYIALLGLKHAGGQMQEGINVERNPHLFPKEKFWRYFQKITKSEADLYIPDNLHPGLQNAGKSLERTVNLLKSETFRVFTEYGYKISAEHHVLQHLSEIAIQAYVTTATLARASRSYCLGFRESQVEKSLAAASATLTHENIKRQVDLINQIRPELYDYILRDIADRTYNAKKYLPEHPLHLE